MYWGKIVAIRKWLPHYDYILYLDADVLIANFSLSLEARLTFARLTFAVWQCKVGLSAGN